MGTQRISSDSTHRNIDSLDRVQQATVVFGRNILRFVVRTDRKFRSVLRALALLLRR